MNNQTVVLGACVEDDSSDGRRDGGGSAAPRSGRTAAVRRGPARPCHRWGGILPAVAGCGESPAQQRRSPLACSSAAWCLFGAQIRCGVARVATARATGRRIPNVSLSPVPPTSYQIGAFLVNRRFHECGAMAHHDVVREQHTAAWLSNPAQYSRVRADLPKTAKSTIALAFSSDCSTLASTHGDHTVKLVNVMKSEIIATLIGHPRTPWTVKFHPHQSHVVASGCLGGELRIWDARTQAAVNQATLPHPVISLSFHPDGEKLAAAAGTKLYIWDFSTT
mmetsp:Transcript_93808/g.268556  ORF Transcript_93808/g.268556 Transcript_93808/m.268556 type:complete len:279 (+) Transcript_93808:589-1425(+)